MTKSSSKRLRGQTSLEFLIVMAVVLGLSSAVMLDALKGNELVFGKANIKDIAVLYLYAYSQENPACGDLYLKGIASTGAILTFDVEGACLNQERLNSIKSGIISAVSGKMPGHRFVIEVE